MNVWRVMQGWLTVMVLLAWLGSPSIATAQSTPDQLIFGPQQYLRTTGAPNQYTGTITVPTSVGAPFLLHIVNGQSNGQNRLSSAWIDVNNVQVAGPADFGQNVAVIDQTITLNPGTNQLKVKVASTPGGYLTVKVYGTKILPTPTSLTPNPLNLTAGASGTLIATIAPAPTSAGTLTLVNSNSAIATVPSSVPFAINQTTISIPVTAVAVGNASITASLNGGDVSATVDVSAAPPTIASLQPGTETITQGATGTLTVTISAARSTNTTVALTSSVAGIASVPAFITVPAGQTSAPIAVSANTPGTAVITASLNGTSASSTITVTPNLPTIVSLLPPTTSINLGATGTLTVTISAVQSSATTIQVTASPSGLVTVPATVTVPAGQLTTTVPVTATALGTAMVHVSLNSSMAESAVQVTPPPPAIVSLLPSPLPLVVGASGTLTVTLNAGQLANTEVALSANPSATVQIPAIVTVPAGQTSASFTVSGLVVGSAMVTASLNGTTKQALIQVQPPPPQVISLLPNPLPLQQGATGSLTLTINAAQVSDTVIALTNSAPTIVQVPVNVTVPANQLTVTIPVTALLAGNATITATITGSTVSALIQVTPPPPVVTLLSTIPPDPLGTVLTRPKGKPGSLRVTLSRAPTDTTVVTLTSSATTVAQVPASVTVPAGALTADFPVNTVGEGTATITASLNGGSATATVTVTPAELVLLTLSPQTPTLFVGETQPMTATGTLTDGSMQNLTTDSRLVWTSTNQTVATITSSGLINALAIGTSTIRATFTPTTGTPTIVETGLTVLVPPALTLTPTTATITVGQSQNFTVGTVNAPGPGGLLVTLAVSGTGTATVVPTSVTILEGQLAASTPVTVTATGAGAAIVTATAPIRTSATATLTINPGPPSITSLSPLTGPVGTVLTITGTSFNPTAANNQITINNVAAIVSSVNATGTTLVTTIPQGATTGALKVTTLVAPPATGPIFTVVPRVDFTLSAAPPQATAVQSGLGSYAITLTPVGNFTNLVNLSVANLPTGATARLTQSTMTTGQTAILTVTPGASTPAGIHPFTLTGLAQLDSGPKTQTIPLNLVVIAGGGQTHVASQFLRPDNQPIADIQVSIGSIQATTDAAGNFLLQNVPSGTQKLMVSGPTPNGPFMYSLDIQLVAGQTNTIPPFYLAPDPPLSQFTPINNATANHVITDARYPGASLTLPAGVVIRGWDNSIKTGITFDRLDADRLGVPPPPKPSGGIYQPSFTNATGVTPMGGSLEPAGSLVPMTIPNDLGLDPGQKAEMWVYDATPLNLTEPSGWRLAGLGTVSADGSTIVADPGVGISRFCRKCGLWTGCFPNLLANLFNWLPGGATGGDPVDLRTGLFPVTKTDLVLPGRMPVSISRTYNSFDVYEAGGPTGNLGKGWYLSMDTTLFQVTPTGEIYRLVLPGSSRLDLYRQPNGTWTNQTHPMLKGAVLSTIAGGDRQLRFNDGATWTFRSLFTFAAGGSIEYLIEQADRNNNTLTITRSGTAITGLTDASGRQVTVSTTGGRISQIQDPLGRVVTYNYNSNGRLETVSDPEGGSTRYTYDSAGHILTITDAKGLTFVQNFYGPSGRVLRQVQADGSEWRFNYKVSGGSITGTHCGGATAVGPGGTTITIAAFPNTGCPNVDSWATFQAGYTFQGGTVSETTVIDPRGNQTVHRFNNVGFDSEVIDALGQKTTFVRNAANQVASSTDALGRTTKFEYDPTGNVTKITDPTNQVTLFEYESAFNRVKKITDALNHITEFTYDPANGNLLTVKDPRNQVTTIAYNTFGQPLSVQGPIATEPPTTFAYDTNGNLITTTDPLGNATQRVYDAVSRLTSLTDPRGLSTQFRYDGLNRVTEIADARQGITRFTYDPNGNLLSVTDAKNQSTTYTYSSMDRLATRKDALNRQETYQYDLAGNLSQFTDRKNQQTTFVYDALNRRTTATYPDSTTSFTYDSVGRLTKASDTASGAGTIDFAYDVLDRLIQEVTGQGSVSYQYDVLGRRTNMVANGQQPVTYGYDAASRLTQVAQGSLAVGLGYDNANRRTSLTYPNGTSTSYTYDVASKLTNINHIGPSGIIETLTYAYDPAGNKTSLTRNNGTASLLPTAVASATYDAANEQTAFAGATLQYDDNGNLTNDGINTYVWDARNRLVAMSGGATAAFSYDPLGRRSRKTINSIGSQFLYDGSDIAAEIGGGAVGASYLSSLNIDEPFIRQTSTGNEHFHTDALGSSLALSNAYGSSATTYTYEPFGKTTVTGTSSNAIQYTGRENDGTGLAYYRARYYQPRLQRFIAEDPIGFAGGDVNLYGYALNNPTRFVDPLGLCWFRPPSEPYVVGRDGSLIEPGPKGNGRFLEDYVPAMHTMGTFHDALVDMGLELGLPDLLINIPTMPGVYIIALEAELLNSLSNTQSQDCGLGKRK